MRISSRKKGEKEQQQAAASEVITEAKSWLAFNYLNKFYFSGHWQEFNFYALFDFVQWHNPQLSVSLKVYLAQSKKNNKTYLKQSRKITSTKMSWIRRDYSTFLKGNFNYLLKSNISFNISWLSTSICLFIRPIRTKSCFLNQAPELDVALLCFGYHHHFKFLVCVKKYCGAPHVKMSQCQGCPAKCLV